MRPKRALVVLGFAGGLLSFGGALVLSYRSIRQLDDAAEWRSHTHDVILEIRQLWGELLVAETTSRGFRLTGTAHFLSSYDAAERSLAERLGSLRRLTGDNPRQQARLVSLELLVRHRVALLSRQNELRRQGQADPSAWAPIADEATHLTEQIQGLIAELEKEERMLLTGRNARLSEALERSKVLIDAAGVLGVGLLALAFIGLDREVRRRRARERELGGAQDLLRQANERLERRVVERTAELQHSEERYRGVLDSMREGFQIIGSDWRYIYLNDEAAAHGQRRKEDLVGRTVMECYPGIETTEMFGLLKRCMEARASQSMENEFTYPDGTKRWFALSIQPAPEGIFVISLDTTERKRAEETLRLSEAKLRGAFEHAATGMALVAPDGRWLQVNQALCELVGYSEGELLAKTVQDVTHPDDLELDLAYMRRLVADEIPTYAREKRYRHKSGELAWALSSVSLIRDGDGQPLYFIAQVQDITGRKLAEERHAHVEEQLRQSQKLEAIGRLAGGIAHDFNNLLGVITGYGELARRQLPEGHRARPRLEEMIKAAERATGLTRQLLAFSRKQVQQPRLLDLNAVATDLDKMLKRILGEDVECEVRPAPNLGIVRADPTQIDQVLLNLIVNARDAMPKGGHLTIETANVEFDEDYAASHPPAKAGRFVMLAVSDTGTGMDAETQRRVFEPFFTTKPEGEGTGLGLATVYGIVKQSGGYIWLYSEPGRGTTFKIYLPRVDDSRQAPSVREASAAVPAPRGHETVLLVEDSEALREVIREVLEEQGYTVLLAAHGEEALALLRKHDGRISLLLTDVVMPKLGGGGLAEQVRQHRPGIRVLFMSGYTDGAISRQGILAEGVALLEKPFTGDRLARAVREALDRPPPG